MSDLQIQGKRFWLPASNRLKRGAVSGTSVMVLGTIAATIGAYLFQLVGARVLGPVAFAPLTVLWTVQFLVLTVVMMPVEQLVIRRLEITGGRSAGIRVSAGPLAAVLALAVSAVLVLALVSRDRVLEGRSAYVASATGLVVGYAVFAVARGYLAGRHRYSAYGIATAAESFARLLLAVALLAVTPQGVLLALAMVAAPLAALLVRPFAPATPIASGHPATHSSAPDGPDALVLDSAGRFLAPLMLANAASQTLLGAAPLAAGVLGAGPELVSTIFVTFALFRGPLWMVQSLLARVLPPVTALARASGEGALVMWGWRFGAAGGVLAVAAWPLGWWLGPEALEVLFGEQFAPSALLAALVAAGTALAAVTSLSGQLLVGSGRTTPLALAWTLALAVSAVTLLLPLSPDVRVGVSFLAGEVTALLAVTREVYATGRHGRRSPHRKAA